MPNGHPYIPRRMNALRKERWFRKRCMWLRFGGGEHIVLRWHHGSLHELENAWRLKGKRHVAFVKGFFTRPELRLRTLMRGVQAKT